MLTAMEKSDAPLSLGPYNADRSLEVLILQHATLKEVAMAETKAFAPSVLPPLLSSPSELRGSDPLTREEKKSIVAYDVEEIDSRAPGPLNGNRKLEPSTWKAQIHPLAEKVGKEVESYFLDHWHFRDEKAKQKFLKAGFSRVTCFYFPEAKDDRIGCACRLLTSLFLVDDILEHLSLAEGQRFNESLMPIMRGVSKPDRSLPTEYIMYDLWANMRILDPVLADATLEPTFVFMQAQTDKARLSITKLGEYFDYRERDVGQALLSSLMRFTMGLHISPRELAPLANLERYCGRHISIVNDIMSWEKELRAASEGHYEGAALCSAVKVLSSETGLAIAASKRVLWSIAREFEGAYTEEATRVLGGAEGAPEEVRAYIRGLEFQMSGNEEWSVTTQRYREV